MFSLAKSTASMVPVSNIVLVFYSLEVCHVHPFRLYWKGEVVQQQEGVVFFPHFFISRYGFIIPDANPDVSTDGIVIISMLIISFRSPDFY